MCRHFFHAEHSTANPWWGRLTAAIALVVSLAPPSVSTAAPDADEILAKADRIRFPPEGFQVDVRVTSIGRSQAPDVREYRILSKGNANTLVLTTAPASERGQVMLMRGRDLWVFMPNVSQPVRLPLSQKLTGQVSNGDLARANFTGDYTPSLARSEVIDGREHYVLQLVGIDRGVTYPRVLYWVDRESYRPHRAEFYTRSNRRLKTCLYEGFAAMGGELRPTRLVMEDALRKGNRSVMEYRDMRLRDLPAEVFTKDYLKKLQ